MAVTREHTTSDNLHGDPSGDALLDQKTVQEGQPGHFLTELLAAQCRQARADAAAILRPGTNGRPDVLAVYPQPGGNGSDTDWIAGVEEPFRKAIQTGKTILRRADPPAEDTGNHHRFLTIIPLQNQGVVRAAAAFRLHARNRSQLVLSQARLESTALLLDHRELQLTANMHMATTQRLRRVLELLDTVNRPARFLEAAMVLCNELAAWFGCNRVSLGLLDGRCVKAKAISHTDTFNRQMKVVQAIEAAMEECFDQDLEVIHPAAVSATVASRSAAALSENHGPSVVLSLPIRLAGEVTAVATLERHREQPFQDLEEIEAIRLICDLCAPRLIDLYRHDRWFGARLAAEARQLMGRLVGHEYTWPKLAVALIFLTAMLMATLTGEYRINATFRLTSQHQQAVVAPFDSFSKRVLVEPGDRVEAGTTVLGTLETAELRLKLASLMAEELGYRKQKAAAMRDRNTADAHIADAQRQKVGAQIKLIQTRIGQAELVAPINGWVISEDRKQQIGAPVQAGEILFEIASIDSLRAELHVPETSIASVAEGQTGTMAAMGHPDQKIRFVIERINPIAEVVENQNVFRVRARIMDQPQWMRPGMEGEARIDAGHKTYWWIASHRLVNWLRMKLWI